MHIISRLIVAIDAFTEAAGRAISWLTLAMVGLVVVVVVLRYCLGIGSIALQESVTYIHATVFMLGLAYTLKRGGHVRVDIFYRQFSPRHKALVDLVGGLLFLLPVSVLIFVTSWDYVFASWAIGETSAENTGLPFVYLLKTLMLIMPATLLLQGISEISKSGRVIAGRDGNTADSHHLAR
jgi:TRAP-type mannitol/chloroaromatic compound transport system permease small subunit